MSRSTSPVFMKITEFLSILRVPFSSVCLKSWLNATATIQFQSEQILNQQNSIPLEYICTPDIYISHEYSYVI